MRRMDHGDYDHAVSVSSTLTALGDVRRFVEEVAGEAHLPDDQTFNLMVAASEAAANAVEHSGREGDEIELRSAVEGGRLSVEVESPGEFILQAQPPQDRSHRGMGLALMAALTHELLLRHRPEGGTLVRLTVRRDECA